MRRTLSGLFLATGFVLLLPSVHAVPLARKGERLPRSAVARLGEARLRHGADLAALAFTPDGRGLLAGAVDGSLVLWDTNTGRERLRLQEEGPGICAVACSPDGKLLVSGNCTGEVVVWDAATGRRVDSWEASPGLGVQTLLFLRDGRSLLTLGHMAMCRDILTGRLTRLSLRSLSTFGSLEGAVLAPDGRTLAIQTDRFISLEDLSTGQVKANIPVPRGGTYRQPQVAFSADSQQLLCLDPDGKIHIRSVKDGKEVKVLTARDICPLLSRRSGDLQLTLNPHWKAASVDGRPLLLLEWPWPDDDSVGLLPGTEREEPSLVHASLAVLSPDGQTLAVAESDRQVRLWDLKTGKQRLPQTPLQGSARYPYIRSQVRVSPNGRLLAFLDWDGILTVTDLATNRPLWSGPEQGCIRRVIFSADGKQLITLEQQPKEVHVVTFRDVHSGKIQRSLPAASGLLRFLAVSPNGRWLAGQVEGERPIDLWDTERQRFARLSRPTPPPDAGNSPGLIQTGIFCADNRTLVTGGKDGHLRLWDVSTGERRGVSPPVQTKSWLAHGGHAILDLSLSANAKVLASRGADGMIHLWQTGTWKHLRRIDHRCRQTSNYRQAPFLDAVVLSPDGRLVVSHGQDETITGWEVETGRIVLRLEGLPGRVSDACFSPEGQQLLTAQLDGTVLVWDLKQLQERAPVVVPDPPVTEPPLPPGALARVGSLILQNTETRPLVALTPDGRLLALGSGGIDVWDPQKGQRLRRIDLRGWSGCNALTFAPDGKTLAASTNGTVHLLDPLTGRCLSRIHCGGEVADALAFSPDGKILAIGWRRESTANSPYPATVLLWDLHKGQAVGQLEGHPTWVTALAFSADGRLLHAFCPRVSNYEKKLPGSRHVWDLNQRKRLAQFPADGDDLFPFAFSPGGRFVASATIRRTEARDALTDRLLLSLDERATSLAFSGDEQVLAVVTTVGEIQLWDPSRGKRRSCLRDPTVPEQRILALSADGRWLVSLDAGYDSLSRIRFWDTRKGKQHRPTPANPPGPIKAPDPIGPVRDLVWLSDGQRLLLEQGGSVARLTNQAGQELLRLTGGIDRDPLDSLALSPDGRLAAFLQQMGEVQLWDIERRQRRPLQPWVGLARDWTGQVGKVLFTRDGRHILALTGAGEVRAWSVATGKRAPHWQSAKDQAAIALSPDGRLLLVGQQSGGGSLVPTSPARLPTDRPGTGPLSCPGGHVLLGRRLFLGQSVAGPVSGDAHEPANQHPGSGHGSGNRPAGLSQSWASVSEFRARLLLAFSPDGRYLVARDSGGYRDILVVYDLVLGRELGTLTGHNRDILTLAFSPDGKHLATGSSDHTVFLWDATWPTLPRRPLPDPGRFDAALLRRDLADPDAERAWRAVWRLALDPERTLPLLRRWLRPARAADPVRLTRLLAELEHNDFARRESARREIQAIGEGAVPTLRRRLADRPSADLKRLLEGLLEDIEPRLNAPSQLLDGRAIAVLERIGTAEARRILQQLAGGTEGHSRTVMAREALQRK